MPSMRARMVEHAAIATEALHVPAATLVPHLRSHLRASASMTDTAYEKVTHALSRVTQWTPPGEKGDWRCPVHGDSTPSLSVSRGDKGVVLKCQAGCDTTAVVDALGLTMRDLFDEHTNGRSDKPEIVATYDYQDEDGQLLFQVVRMVPKTFRQRRRTPTGEWQWNLADTRRVLYRLPRVLEAVQRGHTVFIVEGEKDVHAIEAAGATATCNAGGAGKWRDEYSRCLAGADVVVVADKDGPGQQHAHQVAASLSSVGATVRMVEAATGKDAADHLAAGHTLEELLLYGPDALNEVSAQHAALRARLLTVEQLRTLPPPTFLIDEILVRNTLAVLWGKPGSGKSFVALDWALSVAVGQWWFRKQVDKGGVLYVAGEGVGGLNQRIAAWQTAHTVYDLGDHELYIHPGAINMLDTQWASALVELATELQPALVIADTLARVMVGGDENAARDMGLAIDAANRVQNATNAAVLFVHHDTKEGSSMRGSSALLGAVDTSIECKADGQNMTLKCEKQKDAKPFEEIRMWREEVGGSCALTTPNGRGNNTDNEQAVIDLIEEAAGPDGLSASQIVRLSDIPERTLFRTLKSLARDGAIDCIGSASRPKYRPKSNT